MQSSVRLVALAVLALGVPAFAQNSTAPTNSTVPTITFNPIDPNSVSLATRNQWCTIHRATCTNLCYGQQSALQTNQCDPKNLSNSCVCKNGFSPNPNQYTNTVPYFECLYDLDDCQHKCSSLETCINQCRTTHVCTAQDPPKGNGTTATPPPTEVDPGNSLSGAGRAMALAPAVTVVLGIVLAVLV